MKQISNFELRRIIRKVINECWDNDKKIHYTVDQINYKVGEIMRLNDFHYKYSKSLSQKSHLKDISSGTGSKRAKAIIGNLRVNSEKNEK